MDQVKDCCYQGACALFFVCAVTVMLLFFRLNEETLEEIMNKGQHGVVILSGEELHGGDYGTNVNNYNGTGFNVSGADDIF